MGKAYLARGCTHTAGLVSVVVVFMVVGLVIDSWTSGRSESYGLAVRRVEVRPPPSFHAVDKRSASLRRLLANQALQSSEHRLDNKSPRCPVLPMRRGGEFRRRAHPPIRLGSTCRSELSALAMPSASACHGTANTVEPGLGSRGSSAASGALKIALPEIQMDVSVRPAASGHRSGQETTPCKAVRPVVAALASGSTWNRERLDPAQSAARIRG